MITVTLIVAAIVIVIGGFMLYENGFRAGYEEGYDDGIQHGTGDFLPALGENEKWEQRWQLTASGSEERRAYEKGMAQTIKGGVK